MGVDNDIPRELSDSITQLLGPTTNISLIKFMKAEWKNTVEKKILVLTDHRLVICANKVPSKVEFSLHFLELQGIESTDIKLGLKYEGKKLVVFAISDPSEINEIVFQISDALIQIFPHMTLQKLTGPLDISPPSRMKEVTDKLKSKTLLREASPCGNFSAQYRCMCDLHNLPYLDEVAWDVDTIYLSQNCKMLLLSDFDHLDAKHLVPVISALRHNTWFTTLCSCNVRLTPEAMNEFALVLKTNTTIECVCTVNSFGKSDFVQKIASAISSNISETAVKHFDFKGNPIDDKGAGYLCPVISNLTKGLEHLELSKCRLTHQGVNRLTSALCNNSVHEDTLTYLNLSGNNLKEDITNFHNFLAQPNALTQLNLSGTECALDSIFGALCRGCSLNLEHLNLSNNVFTNKKVRGSEVMVPVSWKQYFSSAVALRSISVANTKLPLEAVKNLLLGINSNEHLKDVRVDLRNTDLREDGALLLETCLGENKNITELDISDNGFDQHTVKIVRALGSNNHLKKLAIGKNFSNLKPKYIPDVIEVIVDLISAENSTIEGLSLADSKLKDAIMVLINALGGNSSLTVLDISGNGMGDYGARMLSKALHINNKLQVLHLDNNNISPQGYKDIAWAMKRNFCLRTIPSPMNDLTAAQAKDLKKTHKAWHQIEEALLRNNSPRRYGSEQAYRLQQGFLLSTSQQAIDRYIVQLLDTIEDLEKGETSIAVMNEIGLARGLMKDAENCRQLLIQLQKIGQKCEESGNVVEKKLKLMAGELQDCLESQLKSTLTSMLTCVQGKSLAVMEDGQFEQKVEEGSEERVTVPKSFCSTVLLEQVATEIYNKTSEVNVSVASYISEELIEGLLQALDKCSKTLISYKSNESELDKRARESIFRSKHKSQDTVSKAPPPTDYRKSVKVGKLRPVSIVSPLSPSDVVGLQSSFPELDEPLLPESSDNEQDETSAKTTHRPDSEAHQPLTANSKTCEDLEKPASPKVLLPLQANTSPQLSLPVPNKSPQPSAQLSKGPLPSPRLDKPPPPAKPSSRPQSTGVAIGHSVNKSATTKYMFKGDHFTPSPERSEGGASEAKPKAAPRKKHVKPEVVSQKNSQGMCDSAPTAMETETLVTKVANDKTIANVVDRDESKVMDTEKLKVKDSLKDKDAIKVKDVMAVKGLKEEKDPASEDQEIGETVSTGTTKTAADLKLSEDEEESSEEEEKAELTDTTDTTSVDSLLEESSTKPERKPEEANKLGKDESQKVKPELSSEEVDKSGKDKSPKVQPKIASAEYKKSGKDKSPKVKPEPSSKEVNKSRKDKSSKVKQEQGSNKKPVKKSEVKVGAFDDLAPASESATLVHITKTRPQPKRNVLTRPTQRKDTEDVSEGMLDFYEQKKVVKEHVVPTVSAPTKPKVKETSTAEDKPEPEMPVKQPKTRLPGKFGRLFGKSSKPQENDTSPPNKSSVSNTSTPDVSTEASPVESGRGGKTPDSPMKVQTPQKLPAQEAPVEREKTPEKEVEEEPENGKDETEEEEKPKEEPVKLEKRLPPGAVGMKGLGGMNLMAEIQRKRVSMVPPKPPPPNKSDRSPSDTSSKPELRERKLKPVTETPTQTATPGDPGPVPKKPMAPTRPPSLLNPKLSSDAAVINRSPNRSLSSSNTEEKKKEETMPESKSQPAERQAPQPPRRPNRPSRPEIPPNRANTVPATKPPAPPVPSTAVTTSPTTRGFADTDETPTAGNESSGDTTANSAAVKRRSSIKDRIALLDKNSNESVRVAEHPATPPPPPPAHTKPKAFAYLCRDNADTSDENESETNAQRKSKSLRGSSSGPPSALANSGTNGELPGNNNNTLVTTPSKNSKPVVPARPLSKVSESPNVGESSKPPDEDKRASNASTGSTQEQDSKQSSKEVEVFL